MNDNQIIELMTDIADKLDEWLYSRHASGELTQKQLEHYYAKLRLWSALTCEILDMIYMDSIPFQGDCAE